MAARRRLRRRVLRGSRGFRGGTWLVGDHGRCTRSRESRTVAAAAAAVVARRGGGDGRARSGEFASDRQRLASGLPHGLVLAPGAQGGLCGGALTGERF